MDMTRTITLDADELIALWGAMEVAMRELSRALGEGMSSNFDEDAGVWVTTMPNPPHVTHMLILTHQAIAGIYNLYRSRRKKAVPAVEWMGVTFERALASEDPERQTGGTITINPKYETMVSNTFSSMFQYALVLSPSVAAQADAKQKEFFESGDSSVCYAKIEERENAKVREHQMFADQIRAEQNAMRSVLRKIIR